MAEMTEEQIAAIVAAYKAQQGKTAASPAGEVMGGGKRRAAGNVDTASILKAPKSSSYGDSLQDDNGKFDGRYEITITANEVKDTDKGKLFRTVFTIDASDNDRVKVGAEKEHAIFWWTPAGKGETHTLWEIFAEAKGQELTGDFADTIFGEEQCMAGTRMALKVSTRPQVKDKSKVFTHMLYSALD